MTDATAKKLTRSKSDRMLAGVCGGIAAYTNMDSSLVRVLWVVFSLLGGSGLLLYIIFMLIIPEEHGGTTTNIDKKKN